MIYQMMDSAYFTSRSQLLTWLNNLLSLSLSKIEETCTGAVACQLAHMMFPGSVNVKKVKFNARMEHEYLQNYKILQTAFNRNNISKSVEVSKLVRGKYQDNLEFMQWFKAFFEQQASAGNKFTENYDASAVRSGGSGGNGGGGGKRVRSRKGKGGTDRSKVPEDAVNFKGASEDTACATLKPSKNTSKSAMAMAVSEPSDESSVIASLRSEISSLKSSLDLLKSSNHGLTLERDFYFAKLRDVEVMAEGWGDGEGMRKVKEGVFGVLYRKEEGGCEEGGNEEVRDGEVVQPGE